MGDDLEKLLAELSIAQREFENQPGRTPRDFPAGPLGQYLGKSRLEGERQRFESGDKMALLAALRICANHDLVMPDWLSKAYIAAYDKVLNCQIGSWDEAFGKPYPGKHLASVRKKRRLRYAVENRINEILHGEDPPPIDERLFESVGREFGVGKTLCSELYYGKPKAKK